MERWQVEFMKMTILMGLSGSGKSTYAKNIRVENTIIVNKDSLREMFFGEYLFDPKIEKLVKASVRSIINLAADKGFNVIIDETNLTKDKRDIYYNLGKSLEMKVILQYVPCFPDTCISRRSEDPRTYTPDVWEKIIGDQYLRLEEPQSDEMHKYDEYSDFGQGIIKKVSRN